MQLKRQYFITQAGNLYCAASVNTLAELMQSNDPRMAEIQTLLTTLVFGEMQPTTAGQSLVAILRNRP